jgi:hypothetical protein
VSALAASVRRLEQRVGLVGGATETCPSCGGAAPVGTAAAQAEGPREDARGLPMCAQCRLPVAVDGLLVTRWPRGYVVHAKVVDLR